MNTSSVMDNILPEILSEIFLHYLSDVIGPDLVRATLPLTHICQRWRTVALSTPRLWSRLHLVISAENARSESSLLSTWITRSSASPLTIHLLWDDPPFSSHHPALEILTQCSERWEDILLYLPMSAFRNGSLNAARSNMPQLTHLSLGVSDEPEPVDSSCDLFSVAPKLISFQSVNCDPTSFRVPWGQLARIPAISMAIGRSIQFLQRLPNLREATFYHHNFSDSHTYPVVLHRNLTTVFLRPAFPGGVDYNGFFLNATLPNLRSLTIYTTAMPATFTTFLSKILALDHLSLHGYFIDDDTLLRSLEVTQFLTHLNIQDVLVGGEDTFLTRLKSRADDSGSGDFALVPKLKLLAILISDPNLGLFAEVVESRAGILRKVQLYTSQPPDSHLHNRLEEIRSTTLSIKVITTG